jgi:hypothetical protein
VDGYEYTKLLVVDNSHISSPPLELNRKLTTSHCKKWVTGTQTLEMGRLSVGLGELLERMLANRVLVVKTLSSINCGLTRNVHNCYIKGKN